MFLQILSLVPGVSRSGIAITGARALKFNRYDSAKISFLLSIPTLAAVSIYGLTNLIKSENFDFSFLTEKPWAETIELYSKVIRPERILALHDWTGVPKLFDHHLLYLI